MEPALHPDWIVSEVMRHWPQTIPVFVTLRLACPGCAMAPFETLGEVAETYGLDGDELISRLEAACAGGAA